MTQEEKAKAYDEALERIMKELQKCGYTGCDTARQIYRYFPELKESEDEKIRKALIDFFSKGAENGEQTNGVYDKDILAWLEKQGEQKPIDKVEPKFKVGDWICNDVCDVHIASIENGMYYFDEGDGLSIMFVDEHYHLWTIEDAMDGDVLFQDFMCGKTFIYNGVNPDNAILYSFIISNDGEDVLPYHIGKPNTGIGYIEENKNIIHPATKEQRDFLFQKMKEEGYVWDSEKKELKIIDWSKHIKYETNSPSIIEENTMWGEEDEDHLNSLIELLPGLTIRHNWLKSLKDRIQHQPKQKWSDEDEYMLDETIQHLKQLIEIDKAKHCGCDVQYYQRDIDWLKSLRPHKQWKPSEEQMDALETAVSSIQSNTLETLYQDLKREKNYE